MRTSNALTSIVEEICSIVGRIVEPLPDNAAECHDFVEWWLKHHGLAVNREVWVKNGDGVVGRFDLVVYDECNCAIEIDRRMVRAKSVQKLLGFDGGRIAMVRGKKPPHDIVGIDATIGLPVDITPRRSKRPSMTPLEIRPEFVR